MDAGPAPDAGSTSDAGLPAALPLNGCTPLGYSVAVDIGGSQTFQLLVDTGSTTSAVAASSCSTCTGVSPLYALGSGATDQDKQDNASYGDGTGWTGEDYQASFQAVGGPASIAIDFDAIQSQSSFFTLADCALDTTTTAPFQGVLGMGPADLELPGTNSFMGQLAQENAAPDIFSVQLCPSGGFLWLGGYDPSSVTAAPQYTPLVMSEVYAVAVTDLQIGGTSVLGEMTIGSAQVDTGTSELGLPSGVAGALASAVGSSPGFTAAFPGQDASYFPNNNCIEAGGSLTPTQVAAMLPTLALVFPDTSGNPFTVTLPGTSPYINVVPSDGETLYCPEVFPVDAIGGAPAAILGDTVLTSNVTIFDVAHSRIGFAPQQPCPE